MKDNEFAIYFENGRWRISRRKSFFGLFNYWSKVGRSGVHDTWYAFDSREDCLVHIRSILEYEEREKEMEGKIYCPTYEEIMVAEEKVAPPPKRPTPPPPPPATSVKSGGMDENYC